MFQVGGSSTCKPIPSLPHYQFNFIYITFLICPSQGQGFSSKPPAHMKRSHYFHFDSLDVNKVRGLCVFYCSPLSKNIIFIQMSKANLFFKQNLESIFFFFLSVQSNRSQRIQGHKGNCPGQVLSLGSCIKGSILSCGVTIIYNIKSSN